MPAGSTIRDVHFLSPKAAAIAVEILRDYQGLTEQELRRLLARRGLDDADIDVIVYAWQDTSFDESEEVQEDSASIDTSDCQRYKQSPEGFTLVDPPYFTWFVTCPNSREPHREISFEEAEA